jgi:hypothetical protein
VRGPDRRDDTRSPAGGAGLLIEESQYRQLSSRLALMAALLGMIARPGQPKSTPAVIAMATIAASQLKLLFP